MDGKICPMCHVELPKRPVNANMWTLDANSKFGGFYVRMDFCSMACVDTAPKYKAPKKPKLATQNKPVQYVYGDLGMVGLMMKKSKN